MRNLINIAMGFANTAHNTINTLNAQDAAEQDLVDRVSNKSIISIEQYYYGTRLYDIMKTELKAPQTFEEEIALPYEAYVVYLANKYGMAEHDYFFGNVCSTKNPKIERFDEGLFCHHIAEECGVSLKTMTDDEYARSKPFDLYKAKNFIYCNYFEHLLLHIKIAQEDINISEETPMGVDLFAARLIWRELSRFYETGKVPLAHKKAAELVQDRYEDYLQILRWMLQDDDFSRYTDIEDFSLDNNGFMLQKIFNDLGGNS